MNSLQISGTLMFKSKFFKNKFRLNEAIISSFNLNSLADVCFMKRFYEIKVKKIFQIMDRLGWVGDDMVDFFMRSGFEINDFFDAGAWNGQKIDNHTQLKESLLLKKNYFKQMKKNQ